MKERLGNYGEVYSGTIVGFIQDKAEEIIAAILKAVESGDDLDHVIRYADCTSLEEYSEETPWAYPLSGPDGITIGLDIQGNEYVVDDGGAHWESFSIIAVEVPRFAEISSQAVATVDN